jgi:hypothetical protein
MELELNSRTASKDGINAADFKSWTDGFQTRLEDLEIAAAQASAREAAVEVNMDPSIYGIPEIDSDFDGEPDKYPLTSWQSQVEEMHARSCGCGDLTRHFRRNFQPLPAGPRSSFISRKPNKQTPGQPRQGAKVLS